MKNSIEQKQKSPEDLLLDKLLTFDHIKKIIDSLKSGKLSQEEKIIELNKLKLIMVQNNFSEQDVLLIDKMKL